MVIHRLSCDEYPHRSPGRRTVRAVERREEQVRANVARDACPRGRRLGYPGLSGVGGCVPVVGFTPAVNGGTLSLNQVDGPPVAAFVRVAALRTGWLFPETVAVHVERGRTGGSSNCHEVTHLADRIERSCQIPTRKSRIDRTASGRVTRLRTVRRRRRGPREQLPRPPRPRPPRRRPAG